MLWAPGGTYRMVGAETLAGIAEGHTDANEAIGALIDMFQFQKVERLATLVDGNRAALHWRITFTSGDSEPATVELCDLWEVATTASCIADPVHRHAAARPLFVTSGVATEAG